MLPQPAIDAAIRDLEHVRDHPRLYLRDDNIQNIEAFLNGFDLALSAAGLRPSAGADSKVCQDRGWETHALGVIPQMQARGMDATAIIRELIEIRVQLLRDYGAGRSFPDTLAMG